MKKLLTNILIVSSAIVVGVISLPNQNIVSQVEQLNKIEKVALKSQTLTQIKSIPKETRNGISIEILEINQIDGGVEALVRAWDKNGQIGFGIDGTVDIERFKIYNPPILVSDPQGDIVRTYTDEITKQIKEKRYKEDPREAILQTIYHAISVKKERFSNEKIITGKIGNTTSTFYPDANPETTTFDGHAVNSTDDTFANMRAGSGAAADDSATVVTFGRIQAAASTDVYSDFRRSFFLFDTSPIPDTDTISSATFGFTIEAGNIGNSFGLSISLVAGTTISNTSISVNDYQGTVGNTTKFSTDKTLASLTADGATYNNFTLNATGISAISKTGVTNLGGKIANDADNSAPTWSSSADSFANVNSADNAGTTDDPALVIEHSGAVVASIPQDLIIINDE